MYILPPVKPKAEKVPMIPNRVESIATKMKPPKPVPNA